MKIGNIEQGVSLYGFEQRFVDVDDYGVNDMLEELVALGVTKFETIGSMVFDQYPRPNPGEVAAIIAAARRHGLTPFSYGGYIDSGRLTGHEPTDDDIILDLTADLMTARELGCGYLRETNIPNHLLPLAADFGQLYGVAVGIEVHAPSRPSDRKIQQMLAVMDEIDSPYLGLIPDFGCFIEKPAAPSVARHINNGANPELLDYIIANRHGGLTEAEMVQTVLGKGGGEAERLAIAEYFGFLSFGPADIDGFSTLLHRALYFHSKFYHVTADLTDPQIPLGRLLEAVVRSGFSGVLMSEYEGHAFHLDDAQEQLERHLRLEQTILTDLEAVYPREATTAVSTP